jgi:phosphohistidine phosphatase
MFILSERGDPMFLYLVQHGEAKREEEDPQRGLTDKGFKDAARTAIYAQKLRFTVSVIHHSGKTRAVQTAQIFADYLKPEKGLSRTDNLAPMDDPEVWADRIAEMDEDVMLVGHLPHLARLAGLLLCGDKERTCVDFKMGGIVCLKRLDGGRWAVEWMVVPEMAG